MALNDLLARMVEGTELKAEFQAEGGERWVSSNYDEELLRITQEALTNVVKHAGAQNFKATLSVDEEWVRLRLVDDGQGFDPKMSHDGFGLLGMRERVERMGGVFTIRTEVGIGTEILVEVKQSTLRAGNRREQT